MARIAKSDDQPNGPEGIASKNRNQDQEGDRWPKYLYHNQSNL